MENDRLLTKEECQQINDKQEPDAKYGDVFLAIRAEQDIRTLRAVGELIASEIPTAPVHLRNYMYKLSESLKTDQFPAGKGE